MGGAGRAGTRSGDIVLVFNIEGGFATVNDGIEEELNGWHGGPTRAESLTPLIVSTPALQDAPAQNVNLKNIVWANVLTGQTVSNACVKDVIEGIMLNGGGK